MLIYELQKQAEIDQYKNLDKIHDLPAIYDYWYTKHITSKFIEVFSERLLSMPEFYAQELKPIFTQQKQDRYIFASLGSGNASLEIEIYHELQKFTDAEIIFDCFEISEYLIEQGKISLSQQGLDSQIRLVQADLNHWQAPEDYAGIIAHHSLHHLVELEHLFGEIGKSLSADGTFVTADMIGRNGHLRWPEALVILQSIWQTMPTRYQHHNLQDSTQTTYENWDCSQDGFEGIRAQDILPLLQEKFYFKKFLGYGNLIDVFIERDFGFNFDPHNPEDTDFIDRVSLLNELLIDFGFLKPTFMFASLTLTEVPHPRFYRHWTPSFCSREVNTNPLDAAQPQNKLNLSYPLYQVSEALKYYPDQWLSSNFSVELYPCHPLRGLEMEGFVPDAYPFPNKLTIWVDKQKYIYDILQAGSFVITLLFDQPQQEKFSLTITASQCWNGHQAGVNQDRRNLVFLLERMRGIAT